MDSRDVPGKGTAGVLGCMEQTANFVLLLKMIYDFFFKAMDCLLLELSISFVEIMFDFSN